MEDRSALFNQLKSFSQRKLKKVETKVVTGTGEQLVEKRGAKGLQVLSGSGADASKGGQESAEPARKLDLQVGYVSPGLLLGSQDVAHDKSSLDNYGITHILNLDADVENKYEDDYNYKNIVMQDKPDFVLEKVLEDCIDFIDDGRHYGNVLVHCSGTIGLSRSTTICIAYLMNKEKQKFDEAFNNVKEARSFVKPNEGFIKQLKDYEVKLRGAQQIKDSGIDDPFALRKKQEIEQEKAMVAGAASVKNRMKMFGQTLDTGNSANRSKSVSPMPAKTSTTQQQHPSPNTTTTSSKWSSSPSSNSANEQKSISKSMTPEPRKSWQKPTDSNSNSYKQSSNKTTTTTPGGPPPPPPPMPSGLLDNDKSVKPLKPTSSSKLPPPPPPSQAGNKYSSGSDAKKSVDSSSADNSRTVFGRVRPPPMKIRGGISMERQDSTTSNDSNTGQASKSTTRVLNYDNINNNNAASIMQNQRYSNTGQLYYGLDSSNHDPSRRCETPMVLLNNVTSQSRSSSPRIGSAAIIDDNTNPFSTSLQHQQTQRNRPIYNTQQYNDSNYENVRPIVRIDQVTDGNFDTKPPLRTTSLGPRRPLAKDQINIFQQQQLQQPQQAIATNTTSKLQHQRSPRFNRMADELKSSLDELDKLIDDTESQLKRSAQRKLTGPKFDTLPPRRSSASQGYGDSSTGQQQRQVYCGEDGQGDDEQSRAEREKFQWEIDLIEWKASSSVNDLRSLFDQPSKSNPPNAAGASMSQQKPPMSASPNVSSKRPQWPPPTPTSLSTTGANLGMYNVQGDNTIRRTTSTSATLRPILRNPYRGQY